MPVNLGDTAVAAGKALVGDAPVAVYVGDTLVLARASGPPAATNTQEISIPASRYSVSGQTRFWQFPSGSYPVIDAALTPGSDRWLVNLQVRENGEIFFTVSSNSGIDFNNSDLSDAFESFGHLKLVNANAGTLIVSLGGADIEEPYQWTPSNTTEVETFRAALSDNVNSRREALTLTIGDGVLT